MRFKIFLNIVLLLICLTDSQSQIKQRSSSISYYTGIGYKFVILTNPTASDAYPFFQLSDGDFLKELDGFFGVTINEIFALEFSPSYLFTNKQSSDGFYFQDNNGLRFYYPVDSRLNAIPLNLTFKLFPFAKNYSSFLNKMYLGGGGGFIYFNEETTNQIYDNESQTGYLGARTYKNDFWTSNFEVTLGISSFSKIGFGFEVNYRFVPLDNKHDKPLVTSLAGNFNSVNLSANIIYTF
ncbi:MAG: hypothetical protein HGGPFJEG_01826 [Ignavibacteria bacterium]|nr:hypothetical protein [Ignavibacteria bacterium]